MQSYQGNGSTSIAVRLIDAQSCTCYLWGAVEANIRSLLSGSQHLEFSTIQPPFC